MATLNGDIDGVQLKKPQTEAASVNNMPSTADMTNGDIDHPSEDPAQALQLLKQYPQKDGISVHALLDEEKVSSQAGDGARAHL